MQYYEDLILLKLSSFPSGWQIFSTLNIMPNRIVHQWKSQGFFLQSMLVPICSFIINKVIHKAVQRDFSSCSQTMKAIQSSPQSSTSMCQHPSILPASHQPRVGKPAENVNCRNHWGKNKSTGATTHSNI